MSSSPEPPGPRPLAGLRVVDLGAGVAAQYTGRLLALHGADVVLVEPPGGTPTRRMPPLHPSGHASGTGSYLFQHLNQGKRAAVRTVETLTDLFTHADVVLREHDDELPVALADTVVEAVFADFPDDGPYAGWRGTEMVHQALSGVMNATGSAAREPIYGLGHRSGYATGTTAYASVLAALHERRRSGRGQRVRGGVFEAAAGMAQNLVSQYSYNRTAETRARYPGFLAVLRCADDWVVLFAIRHWPNLCRIFDLEQLLTDPRFATQGDRLANWPAVVDLLRLRAADRAADDVVAACQAGRISAEKVTRLDELVTSEQWRVREVLGRVADGERVEWSVHRLFDIAGTPTRITAPSPAPPAGPLPPVEPPRMVWSGTDPRRPGVVSTPRHPGPLSDVRVLEFSTAWAGPFAGRCLAHLGADVIKVEAPSHPDSWRGARTGSSPLYYPDLEPGDDPQNRSVLFNSQNLDKRSLALDLKVPGGVEVLHELAARADVVLANFTPGVLDRLGVGHATLSRINPRIIVVEMPAFGPGGPMSRHQGMGKTMEPASGMTALMGYADGTPVLTGPAIMDPTGGLNAVAAVLTALELRERTGVGCRVEVPQVEAAAHWIGEYVLEQLDTGSTWQPDGNTAAGFAPHDAYRCRGEDRWVVIAVGTDAEWSALCTAMHRPDLAADPRYAGADERFAHRHELAEPISAWTADQDHAELADRLQAVGVPAAPVLGGAEIAIGGAVHRAGLVATLEHPLVGRRDYGTPGFLLDRTPGAHLRAAPMFGEHNDAVLGELLGYDDARIAALRDAGVIADRPTADTETPAGTPASPATTTDQTGDAATRRVPTS